MTTFNPDIIYSRGADDATQRAWLDRNFAKLKRWSQIQPEPEVVTYGASITFNAGDGTPHGDLNATDFTGHSYAEGTALRIASNGIVTFGHNAIAYLWTGPGGVLVGLGGNYTALAGDLTAIGTADHAILVNRDLADAHPMSAVTNLINDQTRQDTNLSNHLADPGDPHPQYTLKKPIMLLGGVADNFTLNATDSKLVNYTLSGEANTTGAIDPTNGEITLPEDGVYHINFNILGEQGNTTKEEWIEGRLDNGVTRETVAFLDVTTDKTSFRQLTSSFTRPGTAGAVLSMWMWASAGLGTFDVQAVTFEVSKVLE